MLRHVKRKHAAEFGRSIGLLENQLQSGFTIVNNNNRKSQMAKKRNPPEKKSPVWLFFKKICNGRGAQCNSCQTLLKISNNGTTSMLRHLKSKHQLEFEESLRLQNEATEATEATNTLEELVSSTPRHEPDGLQQSTLEMEVIDASLAEGVVGEASDSVCMPQETKICTDYKPMAYHTIKVTLPEHKNMLDDASLGKQALDDLVLQMIYLDMRPMSIVDDRGFRALLNGLDQRYELPSQTDLIKQLGEVFTSKREILAKQLNEVSWVSLSTDMWTHQSGKTFLTVTAHFITANWELKSCVLDTSAIPESFTEEDIAEAMREILIAWNIQNKIFTIVTDNSETMTEAVKLLKQEHLSCFAHTLHSLVTNSLAKVDGLADVLQKVKNIVQFFNRDKQSETFTVQQQETPETRQSQPKKLISDVKNRWNSSFYMLQRYLELHALVSTALNLLEKEEMIITTEESEVLSSVVIALQPLEEVTRELCFEKTTPVSKIIPIINVLKLALSENSSVMGGVMKELTDTLLDQIQSKFPDLHERFQFYCPTYLDPRFRKFAFNDMSAYQRIQDRLKQELECIAEVTPVTTTNVSTEERTSSSSLWNRYDEDVAQQLSSPGTRPDIELRRYAEERPIPRSSSPLDWWRKHDTMFPQLQEVAKKYLCCPGISVQPDRVYSENGENVYLRRSCLAKEHIDQIIFLNENESL